jgi:hypothetical protein
MLNVQGHVQGALAVARGPVHDQPISMPADFYIDTQQRIVFSKATGVFGRVEAVDHMTRLLSHPDFRPEFNQLADFREIAELALSNADIKDLARQTVFSASSKRAFVVASDLQFGLSRMFGTFRQMAGEPGIMTFKSMAEALSWLSLSAEPDPKLFKLLNPPGHKD